MRTWLKRWRDVNGLTQKQAARAVGIPETTFASYEQGHRSPSVNRAKTIAKKMNDISRGGRVKWTYFFDDVVLITSTKRPEEVS